jgi:Putative esterase
MKMAWSVLLAASLAFHAYGAWADEDAPGRKIEASFPASAYTRPVTGRLLLMISKKNNPEVRLQVGWIDSPPVFGVDVHELRPGQVASIDESVQGYPLRSITEIPPGDYYVQALLNVYTEFHRADGHVIWAHMDRWEGQQFNQSPGNLYSRVQQVHLDGSRGEAIKLSLTEIIPPIQSPADAEWVKHIKIPSKLLSTFWGRPMYLGAVVLLPRDYSAHVDVRYPVIYEQSHFSEDPPFGFSIASLPETEELQRNRRTRGFETGYAFHRSWASAHFPRVIAVTFLHPTLYYDDSYAVNSANVGPYGDAIMTELIPYLETHFRIIREPYARALTGVSTGGWAALALQLFHPEFFGGAWVLSPDPVDFRRYGLTNIYEEDNAFVLSAKQVPQWQRQEWVPPERSVYRTDDGQPVATTRQLTTLETVLGSHGRSGGVLENWEAVYGPVGDDGYPKPLWDKTTGKIDHSVARYMRDHGYDLRDYAQRHWATLGPQLVGKLHFYCGDMDNFYLNLGVYLFEQFLQITDDPHYAGSFEYGRPMKPHGWQPMTNAEFVKRMADEIERNAPQGSGSAWRYD